MNRANAVLTNDWIFYCAQLLSGGEQVNKDKGESELHEFYSRGEMRNHCFDGIDQYCIKNVNFLF